MQRRQHSHGNPRRFANGESRSCPGLVISNGEYLWRNKCHEFEHDSRRRRSMTVSSDEEYEATPERWVAAVVPELKERRVDNRVNATRPGEPFTFQAMDIGRQHVRRRAAR
jgi:hypothetical protein